MQIQMSLSELVVVFVVFEKVQTFGLDDLLNSGGISAVAAILFLSRKIISRLTIQVDLKVKLK